MFQAQTDKFLLNEKENIAENMEKFTLKVSGEWNIFFRMLHVRQFFCAGNTYRRTHLAESWNGAMQIFFYFIYKFRSNCWLKYTMNETYFDIISDFGTWGGIVRV